MEGYLPTLTEPGVKYFLRETLKQCRNTKYTYYSTIFNVGLLILFISLLGTILMYKSKYKPTPQEIKERREQNEHYVLGKVKQLREKKDREQNTIITNLPKFETPFEKLHKNFYKV